VVAERGHGQVESRVWVIYFPLPGGSPRYQITA
jgi:hypothetical protein